MDAFSASLMADKREIVFAPTVYKFQTFAQMAEEFKLGERDVVLTNEFIYTPFMKELGLKCNFVFQEKFGAGEPSEAMIQTMYDAIPYDSYDRVIAVGGQTVDLRDGRVYVDGVLQDEPYTRGEPSYPLTPYYGLTIDYPYTVPEGGLWVMGDNRTNSQDSRYFGAIKESSVTGKAIFIYWPLTDVGPL